MCVCVPLTTSKFMSTSSNNALFHRYIFCCVVVVTFVCVLCADFEVSFWFDCLLLCVCVCVSVSDFSFNWFSLHHVLCWTSTVYLSLCLFVFLCICLSFWLIRFSQLQLSEMCTSLVTILVPMRVVDLMSSLKKRNALSCKGRREELGFSADN